MKYDRPLAGLGLALLSLCVSEASGADAPRTRYTPAERSAQARLKAVHDDVARLQTSRHDLPPVKGREDFRAILHAHAEDSAHTGGTRPEMLAEAKRAGVRAILLTDHYRPPRDFITESWRGLREDVLFVPGSEIRGFLIYPEASVMAKMEEPTPAFVQTVRAGDGLIFLSHVEERPDHPTGDLDGMEIYNRHADAKKDPGGAAALAMKMTDPATLAELEETLRLYPAELLASQLTYPADYLAKWDAGTAERRLTGVAANDCHHNMVFLVTMVDPDHVRVGIAVDAEEKRRVVSADARPGIRSMTAGHKPGDVLARVDLDPYTRSFRNVSTHVLAPTLDEPSIRRALRDGHVYVSHDWVCDPTGFRFEATDGPGKPVGLMGDEVSASPTLTLTTRTSARCRLRLIKNGEVIAEQTADTLEAYANVPGVYRVEAFVTLDGEDRPWLYSNPIYVR